MEAQREQQYREFSINKLVHESKRFGRNILPNAVMPNGDPAEGCMAYYFNVIEIREVDGHFRAGCVKWFVYEADGKEFGERFQWFDLYDVEIKNLDECLAFTGQFVSDFNNAEYEYRQGL